MTNKTIVVQGTEISVATRQTQDYNPAFNYSEFAIIKSQTGLNSYKLT